MPGWQNCLSRITAGTAFFSIVMPFLADAVSAEGKPFPSITYDRAKLAESPDNGAGYKHLMADILERAEGGGMTILNFQAHDCAGCNVQTDYLERLVARIAGTGRNISMINVVAYDAQGAVYPNITGHLYREVTGVRQLSLPHGQIWTNARYSGEYFSITDGDDLQQKADEIGKIIVGEAAKLPIIPDFFSQ